MRACAQDNAVKLKNTVEDGTQLADLIYEGIVGMIGARPIWELIPAATPVRHITHGKGTIKEVLEDGSRLIAFESLGPEAIVIPKNQMYKVNRTRVKYDRVRDAIKRHIHSFSFVITRRVSTLTPQATAAQVNFENALQLLEFLLEDGTPAFKRTEDDKAFEKALKLCVKWKCVNTG